MPSDIAWPYRIIDQTPFTDDSGWRLTFAGEEAFGYQELGSFLEGWDAESVFTLERQCTVDGDALRGMCGLPAGAELQAAVLGSTGNGRIREVLWRTGLPAGEPVQLNIRLIFGDAQTDGMRRVGGLSHDLRLETVVVLGRRNTASVPFTATQAGSRLWMETSRVNLQGSQPRLPVAAVSFREYFPFLRIENADYYVSLDQVSSLESEILDSVAVYVNADSGQFVENLSAQDPEVLQQLYEALTVQITMHVILNGLDREGTLGEAASGTVGAFLREVLAGAFPDADIETVKAIFTTEPGRFLASVQSYAKSLGVRAL